MKIRSVFVACFITGLVWLIAMVPVVNVAASSCAGPTAQEPELLRDRTLVVDVQRRLADRGYYHGAIDGQVGPQTRAALREFQQAHRLPVTGRIDEATVQELGLELSGEREEKREGGGFFGKIGGGVKTAGEAVTDGAVGGAKATAKGSTEAAKGVAKGSTEAAKGVAKGSTVAAKSTAESSAVAGTAAGKASATAGKATGRALVKAGKVLTGSADSTRPDEEIHNLVIGRFKRDPQIDPDHIDVRVAKGVVTLSSKGGTEAELARAAQVAEQVEGVKKVVIR